MSWPATTDDDVASGSEYYCHIDRKGDWRSGAVLTQQGVVRWRYEISPNPSRRSLGNPLKKADFTVTDGTREILFRRTSFCPSRFDMLEADNIIGKIYLLSILRNKYAIEIEGVGHWIFRMPLFTIRFWGGTSHGADIWVVVGPSKMEWSILLKEDTNAKYLLPALAFIHNEWWNYS